MILMHVGPHAMESLDSKEQGCMRQTGILETHDQGFQDQTGQLRLSESRFA